jgi:hypothetical protein
MNSKRPPFFLAAGMLALLLAASSRAADSKQVFTDAEKAGEEYRIQGEYAGAVKNAAGEEIKFGVQVIALGDNKFKGIFYVGGLPGDGWKRGDKTIPLDGELKNGEVKFEHEGKSAVIKGGKIELFGDAGKSHGELAKTERKSDTLGKKPPEGAVVLFDDKADEWNGGKVSADGYLVAGSETKKKFGDCTLHLEFRTPFQPKDRGQGRGNSGVYLNSMYELQVLDSFGLSGENNECGGFYSIRQPDVNMCLPPLAWQTYDIDFTAAKYDGDKKTKSARVTVKHNGVTIHDNIELDRGTPGRAPEGPAAGGLFLQDHGNPVVYRNIWIVEKK